MMSRRTFGAREFTLELQNTLVGYLEAQYHIRDEGLLNQRRKLFTELGTLWQVPYLESTPTYEISEGYGNLGLPVEVEDILTSLSKLNVGVYPAPYTHQAQALQAFFGNQKSDLVISTGTGSGKTESFLMPIIGQLALENARGKTSNLPGVRALLLYPMNALVNDQLSRVRRIFGSEESSLILQGDRKSPVRFATYTSRTPYPGARTDTKDGENIKPLFENYYLKMLNDEVMHKRLQSIGKWPSKDIEAFYAAELEEEKTFQSGKRKGKAFTRSNFKERLITQPNDRELLTRHEIQLSPPELLITNYSMLEYMLLRPIEASIFKDTREWLAADQDNEFILVVDEAHMYRGTGGAEVAYLIRRLTSRLGISRSRLRVIMTSASLGPEEDQLTIGRKFLNDLTGTSQSVEVVLGDKEKRPKYGPSLRLQLEELVAFPLDRFEAFAVDISQAEEAIKNLGSKLGWGNYPGNGLEELQDYVYQSLQGFPPAEQLLEIVSGNAEALQNVESQIFQEFSADDASSGLSALIALCAFAKSGKGGKVFLPSRLHLLFRGVPGLFVCINPKCCVVEENSSNALLMGKMSTVGKITCSCGGRIYELLTHRDCGKAFIRGYVEGLAGDFLWHEQSGPLFQENKNPLNPIELLIDGAPHAEFENYSAVWVDSLSGKILMSPQDDADRYRKFYIPTTVNEFRDISFERCPCCLKRWRDNRTKIMDLATKGEAPFANLVKTMLMGQPATREENRSYPNGGRKVLLFSDGRQKAARLARDIPREVQSDTFRQSLLLAVRKLENIKSEARPDLYLYISFLAVVSEFNLSMFDGDDAESLAQHVRQYEDESCLEDALEELRSLKPPHQYQQYLIEQLCGRFYSLVGTTLGYLSPTKGALERLNKKLSEDSVLSRYLAIVPEVAQAWLTRLAESYSLDSDIPSVVRMWASRRPQGDWGSSGKFSRVVKSILTSKGLNTDSINRFEKILIDSLATKGADGSFFINPNRVRVNVAIDTKIIECESCHDLGFFSCAGFCSNCGSAKTQLLDAKTSPYIQARKGFWRRPVEEILAGSAVIRSIDAQEHSAQLAHRDSGEVYSTTEQYELRFQDIPVDGKLPIDILSSTTTMEVGVDIGSLVAVGLRNVPPQRENYQQRAGRAGRRGSSLSIVATYAQNGPHDTYYFDNPWQMVAGPTRTPEIKIDNPKIAKRHIHSHLLQLFFHRLLIDLPELQRGKTAQLEKSLGLTADFFNDEVEPGYNYKTFSKVMKQEISKTNSELVREICEWLPQELEDKVSDVSGWIKTTISGFLETLGGLRTRGKSLKSRTENLEDDSNQWYAQAEFLEFLFAQGLLPSYAFPTDLSSFLIEKLDDRKVRTLERPQQAISTALSEYAPGRLVVINKKTYRSGGISGDVLPTEYDRAATLFENILNVSYCNCCSYLSELKDLEIDEPCPVCGSELQIEKVITPEVFNPEGGKAVSETDRDQDITYATYAQFPIPDEQATFGFRNIGAKLEVTHASDCRLITLNRGDTSQAVPSGFFVCKKCGKASIELQSGPHRRSYFLERNFAKEAWTKECDGEFENVFLGHTFETDLLLFRLRVDAPFVQDISDQRQLRAIEDALYTLTEAIKVAACTHPELDLDESEFGAGFRILPAHEQQPMSFDLYLYDTLAGGAGYSEIASRYADEIVSRAIERLERCPAECGSSCQSCLRHYRNQHIQSRLDRYLAIDMLRYAMQGELSPIPSLERQISMLSPLTRLLEIDGVSVDGPSIVEGIHIPATFSNGTKRVAVGVYSGLLDIDNADIEFLKVHDNPDYDLILINEYLLKRNLPEQHQRIRRVLGI
jgi:ATP-dependent helicase YprA (DUF1998 family)